MYQNKKGEGKCILRVMCLTIRRKKKVNYIKPLKPYHHHISR